MGYGTPPEDEDTLQEIAKIYHVEIDELKTQAANYLSRPTFVIEQAKRKLKTSAKLIGEIVERKKIEQELEFRVAERTSELQIMNSELEAFSYSVAHDLRSPLRSIAGFSAILAEEYSPHLDTNGLKLLSTIRANVDRMDVLITGLLDLAKLSRNSTKRTWIDMQELVKSVYQNTQDKETQSMFDVQIGELQDAYADRTLFSLVWQNLIGNAIKFSIPGPSHKIVIESKLESDEVIYSIQDFGVGFDMKYSDKVFGAFERLHKESEFKGTGIGLAIVHRIISRHNGRIWVESEIGVGTTFYFAIPIYSA
jgi:light-regulated signal transduction histidine kinase (bacteriophytochrome)